MSIFSGWEAGDLERLRDVLTGSPQGVMMLAVFVLIFIALIYILVHIISHQISNFYMKISEEEADDEEEKEEPGSDQAQLSEQPENKLKEEVHE